MAGYIPKSDIEFDQWLEKFKNYVVAHSTSIGVSTMEKSTLVARHSDWETAYQEHINEQAVARGKKETKDNKQTDAEKYARYLAQRITTFSGTSDEDREGMGLTIRDTTPTPISPEYVMELEPPLLKLDLQSGQVTIHFGVNPGNENSNAKPKNIAGAKIWYRVGVGEWKWAGDDTNSPYRHNIDLSTCGALEYRAQWFDKKMRVGLFSMVAPATVS